MVEFSKAALTLIKGKVLPFWKTFTDLPQEIFTVSLGCLFKSLLRLDCIVLYIFKNTLPTCSFDLYNNTVKIKGQVLDCCSYLMIQENLRDIRVTHLTSLGRKRNLYLLSSY